MVVETVFSDKSCNNNRITGRGGFTLIELMVALVVFMVVMLGIAAGMIQSLRANTANVGRDDAAKVAADELNRLRNLQFSASATDPLLNANGWQALPDQVVFLRAGNRTFSRLFRVTDINTSIIPLKRIEVAVGWDNPHTGALPADPLRPPFVPDRNRQTTLSTIMARTE